MPSCCFYFLSSGSIKWKDHFILNLEHYNSFWQFCQTVLDQLQFGRNKPRTFGLFQDLEEMKWNPDQQEDKSSAYHNSLPLAAVGVTLSNLLVSSLSSFSSASLVSISTHQKYVSVSGTDFAENVLHILFWEQKEHYYSNDDRHCFSDAIALLALFLFCYIFNSLLWSTFLILSNYLSNIA